MAAAPCGAAQLPGPVYHPRSEAGEVARVTVSSYFVFPDVNGPSVWPAGTRARGGVGLLDPGIWEVPVPHALLVVLGPWGSSGRGEVGSRQVSQGQEMAASSGGDHGPSQKR